MELHFEPAKNTLRLIFSDEVDALRSRAPLLESPWILSGTLSRERTESELRLDGIPYVVRPYEHEGNTDEVITEAQVCLLFQGGPDTPPGQRRLTSVSLEE